MNKYCILLIISIINVSHACCGFGLRWKSKKEALTLISAGENFRFPDKHKNISQSNRYFCPAKSEEFQNFNKFCLIESEENYCNESVKPLLIKSQEFRVPCGPDGKSFYYDFVYRVCSQNKNHTESKKDVGSIPPIKTNDVLIYRICYDTDIKRAIFTYHKITKSKLLATDDSYNPDKNLPSFSINNYNVPNFDFNRVKHAYFQYNSHFRDEKMARNHTLKPLMLVPSDDIGPSLWKESLYHYINVVPAWKHTIEAWKLVNTYIRNMASSQGMTIYQINGVLGELMLQKHKVYLDPLDNVTVPKYIWKLVYTEDNEFLTIVINNVPTDAFQIERLCPNNEYDIFEWRFPINFRPFVYFCKIDDVRTLFHLPENLSTLEEEDNFAPLILTTNEGNYVFPKTYHRIPQYESQYNFCYEGDYVEKSAKEDRCLIPIPNNRHQYCSRPLEPLITNLDSSKIEFQCKGVAFSFGYQVCSKTIYNKKNSPYDLAVYNGCQDNNLKETIFTYHRILSPALLINENLEKDRQKSYQMERSNESRNPKRNPNFDTITETYMTEYFNHPLYGWIRQLPLTSPDDMAFALWRKPTFHRINMKFAWENVIKTWSKINERIRTQAINKNQELIQLNGWEDQLTINGEKIETKNGNKLPAYFWKIVYTPDKERSVAIILHNLPNTEILSSIKNLCMVSKSKPIFKIDDLAYCCESNIISEKYEFPKTNETIEIEGLC